MTIYDKRSKRTEVAPKNHLSQVPNYSTSPSLPSVVSCRMHRLLRASSSSSIYIPIPSTIHKTICKVNLNQHTSGTTTESLNCCPDSRPSFLMRIARRAPLPSTSHLHTRFDGKLCTSRYSILLLIPPLLLSSTCVYRSIFANASHAGRQVAGRCLLVRWW